MELFSTNDAQTRAELTLQQNRMMALQRPLKSRENKEDLMKAAREFEGVFFKQLLSAMDKTVDRSGLLSGGSGEEMFRGMMYDKISEMSADRPGGSGLGLAEMIYKQLALQLPKEAQVDGEQAHD